MDIDERVCKLESDLKHLRFQVQLLYENTDMSRYLFECNISEQQYHELGNLMEAYRQKISKHVSVSHGAFEESVFAIVPQIKQDYHFCELFTKQCMEDGRWEEVFPALYGQMDKYKHLFE